LFLSHLCLCLPQPGRAHLARLRLRLSYHTVTQTYW
jgi:hypothetical protein